MRSSLVVDQTERQAAHELEHGMRRFGALRASFEPIVAVGDRSALPHYGLDYSNFMKQDSLWWTGAPSAAAATTVT
jgi:Xaa-Pro aminopeptidase